MSRRKTSYEDWGTPNRPEGWRDQPKNHTAPNTYEVVVNGTAHKIEAHFCFDNGEEGLILRKYMTSTADRTEIVFRAGAGKYDFVRLIQQGGF